MMINKNLTLALLVSGLLILGLIYKNSFLSNHDHYGAVLSQETSHSTYTSHNKSANEEPRMEVLPVTYKPGNELAHYKEEIRLSPITFKADSKEYDDFGKRSYQKLLEYVKETPVSGIRNILLLGHAEGSTKLGIKKFDANSRRREFKVDNEIVKSFFNEMVLEDMRFILSWGRAKKVYIDLQNDAPEKMDSLFERKSYWVQAVGTSYGDKLMSQNIVQIGVWHEGSTKPDINTNPEVKLGGSPAGPTGIELYDKLRLLNYNANKFLSTFAVGERARKTQLFDRFSEDILDEPSYRTFKHKYD